MSNVSLRSTKELAKFFESIDLLNLIDELKLLGSDVDRITNMDII